MWNLCEKMAFGSVHILLRLKGYIFFIYCQIVINKLYGLRSNYRNLQEASYSTFKLVLQIKEQLTEHTLQEGGAGERFNLL